MKKNMATLKEKFAKRNRVTKKIIGNATAKSQLEYGHFQKSF